MNPRTALLLLGIGEFALDRYRDHKTKKKAEEQERIERIKEMFDL